MPPDERRRLGVQPRLWLVRPDEFGRAPDAEWRADDDAITPQAQFLIQIARVHHEIAVLARQRRGGKGWESWSQVAEAIPELGVGGFQLRAIMRGEAGLSMRHAIGLDRRLGPLFMGGFGVQNMLRDNQQLQQRLREAHKKD